MTTTRTNAVRAVLAALVLASVLSCGGDPQEPSAIEQPVAATYTLTCPAPGFNGGVLAPIPGTLPFVPLGSLAAVPNPVFEVDARGARVLRADLGTYVADMTAAIQLGKALFWDIQAGSDNQVACATCHFQAGADVRTRNQLHPGANGSFDVGALNSTLGAASFPFVDPVVGRDLDDVSGSQGVRSGTFVGITSTGGELVTPVSDPLFDGVRRTTGLNAPTVVNAVFNHRNFFNGRAQPEFNGVNPWGARDTSARIWAVADSAGNLAQYAIRIANASLASQAVGPALNPVEMSAAGRTFPDLGRKMLLVKPLGLQKVDATDGVLGNIAERKLKGLKTTYRALIQTAFQPSLWNSANTVTLNGKAYSLMEANFALFWGLSIMLYEGTLVADDSPMDRYVASRTFETANGTGVLLADDPALLDPVVSRLAAQGVTVPTATGSRPVTRADILTGIDLFEKPLPPPGTYTTPPGAGVGCSFCHIAAETTSASIRNLMDGLEIGDLGFKNAGFDLRMERMFMGVRPPPGAPQPPPPVPFGTDVVSFDSGTYAVTVLSIGGTPVTPQPVTVETYDVGWYDVGVRPVADDLGLGGLDPFGKPLSWTEYYQVTRPDPSTVRVPGGGLICVDANGNPVVPPAAPTTSLFAGEVLNPATGFPLLSGGLLKTEATDVAGSFKTASLRNVELSGPYFHTGGKATLNQVVELYDDGGNFANATLSPVIRPLGLTPDQRAALVAFLLSLTDDRVMYQRAPFDHPELPIPAGQDASGADLVTLFPAVGAGGTATPLPRYLGLNPFQ